MAGAPEIGNSTSEERRAYIKERYPCISDCDMCGLCKVFRGKDAEMSVFTSFSVKESTFTFFGRRKLPSGALIYAP